MDHAEALLPRLGAFILKCRNEEKALTVSMSSGSYFPSETEFMKAISVVRASIYDFELNCYLMVYGVIKSIFPFCSVKHESLCVCTDKYTLVAGGILRIQCSFLSLCWVILSEGQN